MDMTKWKRDIHNHSDDPTRWKQPEKMKKIYVLTLKLTKAMHRESNSGDI